MLTAAVLGLLLAPPGISHRVIEGMRGDTGPFVIHVLEVDVRHPAIDVVPVQANGKAPGRETVLAMAQRYGAAAAINGGYFFYAPYDGFPAGNQMIDGKLVASGAPRSALIFCREKDDVERLAVAPARFEGRVETRGWRAGLDGVNRPRQPDELILYTAEAGESTRTTSGTELLLDPKGRMLEVREGGNAPIPTGGSVLSAPGKHRLPAFRPGQKVEVRAGAPQSACPATDLLGAGPALVRDGRPVVQNEGFRHAAVRHPRTAVGIRPNGDLLLVTVDGRQAASIGMSLPELAALLVELGARHAINLDGGGSTTMVLEGKVVNRPSDPFPRPVSDAILVFSTSTASELERLRQLNAIEPAMRRVLDEAARGMARLARRP
jgi:hypothetical protein